MCCKCGPVCWYMSIITCVPALVRMGGKADLQHEGQWLCCQSYLIITLEVSKENYQIAPYNTFECWIWFACIDLVFV